MFPKKTNTFYIILYDIVQQTPWKTLKILIIFLSKFLTEENLYNNTLYLHYAICTIVFIAWNFSFSIKHNHYCYLYFVLSTKSDGFATALSKRIKWRTKKTHNNVQQYQWPLFRIASVTHDNCFFNEKKKLFISRRLYRKYI